MSKQLTIKQAFYKGVQGVFAQGRPSYDPIVGACRYNGPNNTHCAIGHIVEDPSLLKEGYDYDAPIISNEIERQTGLGYSRVLHQLQNAHDDSRYGCYTKEGYIKEFMERCAQIAERNGLTYTGDQ